MIAFNRVRLSYTLIVFSLMTIGATAAERPMNAKDFLGETAVKTLDGADKLEVFRIAPMWEKKKDQSAAFAGYPLLATAKDQGKEYLARLSAVMKDDRSYDWGMAKACEFGPGIAFRISSGKDSFIVLVCFQCSEIGVITDESTPTKMRVQSADRARPALLKLAREAFPDDKILKSVKD